MLRRLLAHVSVYTAGSVLVTVAGFISFPIFTRLFTVEEYGLISLIAAALLFLVGLAKLGVQHSIVRFYGESITGKRGEGPTGFYSTVFFGLAGSGFLAASAWVVASQVVPPAWWGDPRIRGLLLIASALVLVRCIDSSLVNILRAQQRSVVFNFYAVLKKYGVLVGILGTVYYVIPGLEGFYAGTLVVEAIAVAALFLLLRSQCGFSPSAFSLPLYRSMLAFGIPMIAYELGGIVLHLGDRFVIQYLLGREAVGHYSAAYNLCEYVQTILITSIGQAIVPMYIRLWEERGEAETRKFVEAALRYFVMLSAAIVAGLGAVGADLLALLASEKYVPGAAIMPYVAAGMVIGGAGTLLGVGLNIYKQTHVLVVLVVGCAILNLVLNAALIPHFGIEGSAIATLVTFACLTGLTHRVSSRRFRIGLPWAAIAKFSLLSIGMYALVVQVNLPVSVVSVAAKVALGACTYALLVFVFDRPARSAVMGALRRLRRA